MIEISDWDGMTSDSGQPLPRFDGAVAWSALTPDQQAEIGAIALEYALAATGYQEIIDLDFMALAARPLGAAEQMLHDDLLVTVGDALSAMVPALTDHSEPMPVPLRLGQICRMCGCSHYDPCEGGCGWAEDDLCTSCAGQATPGLPIITRHDHDPLMPLVAVTAVALVDQGDLKALPSVAMLAPKAELQIEHQGVRADSVLSLQKPPGVLDDIAADAFNFDCLVRREIE